MLRRRPTDEGRSTQLEGGMSAELIEQEEPFFEIGDKVAYMDHNQRELVTGWVHELYPNSVAVRLNEFRNGLRVIVLKDYNQLVGAV